MNASDQGQTASSRLGQVREFVARSSTTEIVAFLVGLGFILRYLWLADDSFIYFRYVDNWVFLGRGLVYNPGEFVEGFTSPAWVLSLALLRVTRLDFFSIVGTIGVASYVGAFVLWSRVDRKLAGPLRFGTPLLLLAPCYGVCQYFSSGLETPLVLVAGTVTVCFILDRTSHTWGILVGLLPIVRHELAVPLLLVLVWTAARERRIPWWPVASAALSLGGWACFRIYYFAELLPNTFYLKDESNPTQGWLYLKNCFAPYPLAYVAAASLVLLTIAGIRRRAAAHSEARLVMLATALVSLAYVVRVGGDMLHFRFVLFPAVLIAMASSGVLESALAQVGVAPGRGIRSLVMVGLLVAGGATYPPQLNLHPATKEEKMLKVDGIEDSSWHRHQPDTSFREGRPTQDVAQRAAYAQSPATNPVAQGIILHGWCAKLYRNWRSYALHDWGLTDPWLARLDIPADRPGHKYRLNRVYGPQLARARRNKPPVLGDLRRAVEGGYAPPFIAKNLEAAELIERKVYNRHSLRENVGLAFTFVPKLQP